MNPFATIPGLGALTDAMAMYKQMTPMERDIYLGSIAVVGFALGYSFVQHPEILPESIKGIGEITKGIGEVIPL